MEAVKLLFNFLRNLNEKNLNYTRRLIAKKSGGS